MKTFIDTSLDSFSNEELKDFSKIMIDKNAELDQENRVLQFKLFACSMIFLAIMAILFLKIFNG